MTILTYPLKGPSKAGDWAVVPVYNEDTQEPKLPVAIHALDVDRLISVVRAQLSAIISGADIPDFSIPDVEPDPDPYSPKGNFFRAWSKDENGNWILVGLTLAETREFMEIEGWVLDGNNLTYVDATRDPEKISRSVDLRSKHEEARLMVCAAMLGHP